MDWTGLDSWTGQLDWTIGLDYWTGLLDWTIGLDYWTGFRMGFFPLTKKRNDYFQTSIFLSVKFLWAVCTMSMSYSTIEVIFASDRLAKM